LASEVRQPQSIGGVARACLTLRRVGLRVVCASSTLSRALIAIGGGARPRVVLVALVLVTLAYSRCRGAARLAVRVAGLAVGANERVARMAGALITIPRSIRLTRIAVDVTLRALAAGAGGSQHIATVAVAGITVPCSAVRA
jgi:hypothetical protein